MNDIHCFLVKQDGSLLVENCRLAELKERKHIPGRPVGVASKPSDVDALECSVDKKLIRLWQMIIPVANDGGFGLQAEHVTTPHETMSISSAVQSLNLGMTLPGTTEEANAKLTAEFDFSTESDSKRRDLLTDRVFELQDKIGELGEEVGFGDDWEFGQAPETVPKKMWVYVVVESPDHAKELMPKIEEFIRLVALDAFWKRITK